MTLSEASCLYFARGYRLQHDPVRKIWIIQAPERSFITDQTASIILRLVDGQRNIGAIIDNLCTEFEAPREVIAHDVFNLFSDLAEKGVLRL